MIKRVSLAILLCFAALNLSAQISVDRFSDYDTMVGKEVRLYNASIMTEHQGYFAYKFNDGKPSQIKKDSFYQVLSAYDISVAEVVKYKRNSYLKAKLIDSEIYLIIDKDYDYLSNSRSASYWAEKNDSLVLKYAYIHIESNIVYGDYHQIHNQALLSKYVPITWLPIEMPKQLNGEVLHRFKIAGNDKVYALSPALIEKYAGDFVGIEQFLAEQEAYNGQVQQANDVSSSTYKEPASRDEAMDSRRVFLADVKLNTDSRSILSEYDISWDLGVDLIFSAYGVTYKTEKYSSKRKKYYKGYLLQKDIELPEDVLSFRNEEDKVYLDRRGAAGETERKKMALSSDIEYTIEATKYLTIKTDEAKEKLDKLYSHYKKNNILILEQKYSYAEYGSRFGLAFQFFNCYTKDIKYILLTVVAYNQVGDKQRDDIGKHTREARCIGPIAPNESGTYDFNELFWDDNDVINKLKLEKVVVTFMDGTTRTYSGKTQVDRLRVENHPSINLDKPIKVGSAKDFNNLISGINWRWTESQLVDYLGYKVKRQETDIWEEEHTISRYAFSGVTVCGIPLADSNIRVNQYTKKLFRLNFIVLMDATDLTIYPKIDKSLIAEFGQPTQTIKEERGTDLIWVFDNYRIKASYMDMSNVMTTTVEEYAYIISVEPIKE